MPAASSALILAALFLAAPPQLRVPGAIENFELPEDPTAPGPKGEPPRVRPHFHGDAVPMPPLPAGELSPPLPGRKLGTSATIFVNFDGVTIEACSPSNSHENCHWLERGRTFEPFSGDIAQRVAILDAMREQVAGFGVRVTGQRPPADEAYMMLVYGGESDAEEDEDEEAEAEALGRAPAGDCYDELPNQIGYVYLDGERADWINGGASTALHEAGHTWGFDHIGLEGSLMAPMGGNTLVDYFDGCAQIVEDVEFTPAEEGSCPEISLEQCGLSDFQHDVALLQLLFGPPYVDDTAPKLELRAPIDGAYFQAPASFEVAVSVVDDLHPQIYELEIAVPGLIDNPAPRPSYDGSFEVVDLPVGTWAFELSLRDAAGNAGTLSFSVEVGEDPPPEDNEGCGCTAPQPEQGTREAPAGLALLALFALVGWRGRARVDAR